MKSSLWKCPKSGWFIISTIIILITIDQCVTWCDEENYYVDWSCHHNLLTAGDYSATKKPPHPFFLHLHPFHHMPQPFLSCSGKKSMKCRSFSSVAENPPAFSLPPSLCHPLTLTWYVPLFPSPFLLFLTIYLSEKEKAVTLWENVIFILIATPPSFVSILLSHLMFLFATVFKINCV